MASRIFVILTDRPSNKQLANIRTDDIVVVGPSVDPVLPPGVQGKKVPVASELGLQAVTRALAEGLARAPKDEGRDIVECVLNDCYAYAIRPAYSTVEFIRQILREEDVERIILVAAKRYGSGVPLVGFRTTESRRGSRELLGAYIAQAISGCFPEISTETREARGDFLCIDLARKAFMACANVLFLATFSLKCLIYLRRGNLSTKRTRHGVIIRVPHQARFAARLLSGAEGAVVLAFPQTSQGSICDFGRMVRDDLAGCAIEPVSLRALFRAVGGMVRDLFDLRKFARKPHVVNMDRCEGGLRVDLSDIARELMIYPVLVFYKNVLKETIVSSRCLSLVNFELVGRMAGIESLVARQAGIPSTTVQTAVVSATPHVVFPWSKLFLADGPDVALHIEGIGAARYGVVRYAGSALSVQGAREASDAKSIGFFTQPYEPVVTQRMLELLCDYARARGTHIYLKLHPRDDGRVYQDIITRYTDVLEKVCFSADVLLDRIDLCVTRTSSVAREAVAVGIPILLCLWTRMDRSVRADYVQPGEESDFRSWGEADLMALIADYAGLKRAADELRQRLFGGLGIENLKGALFHDSEGTCRVG